MVKGYLKYDDVKIFRYENFYLSIIYTIGHIFVAMACNRVITGVFCTRLNALSTLTYDGTFLLATSPSPFPFPERLSMI